MSRSSENQTVHSRFVSNYSQRLNPLQAPIITKVLMPLSIAKNLE